ncbi:H-NS histone family protein [Ruegeria hyattellae]|uniref:H-NS histone family protein n=1 Tax=Ruegeria hyattellae TaxID=3233337 RepID=UPI00355C97D8
MKIDLKKMNAADLKALAKDIEETLVHAEKEALSKALKEIHKVAKSHGVTLEEIIAHFSGPKKKAKAKVAAKYRNPDDPKQTWSGRGRKPNWVNDAIKAGKSIDELEI